MSWHSPLGSRDPTVTPLLVGLAAGQRGIAWGLSWGHMTPVGVPERQEPQYPTPSHRRSYKRNPYA